MRYLFWLTEYVLGGGIESPWFRFAAMMGPSVIGTPFSAPVATSQTFVVPLPGMAVPFLN